MKKFSRALAVIIVVCVIAGVIKLASETIGFGTRKYFDVA